MQYEIFRLWSLTHEKKEKKKKFKKKRLTEETFEVVEFVDLNKRSLSYFWWQS